MALPSPSPPSLLFFFLSFFLFLTVSQSSESDAPQTFIIHVAQSQKPFLYTSQHSWYTSILRSLPSSPTPTPILYTYSSTVRGFSAHLTPTQATHLRRHPSILAVEPDQIRHLHTTHTPDFLGLAETSGLWPNSHYADDVIIGVLDTGIWPEHRSFSDSFLTTTSTPSSWKGTCETSHDFPLSACNGKIIGAKAFFKGYEAYLQRPIDESVESKSPRDTEGHGTHTASTAAGSIVSNASLFHNAKR